MNDPKIQNAFQISLNKLSIVEEVSQMKEWFGFVSILAVMKFAGGSISEEDLGIFLKYISSTDNITINQYYNME